MSRTIELPDTFEICVLVPCKAYPKGLTETMTFDSCSDDEVIEVITVSIGTKTRDAGGDAKNTLEEKIDARVKYLHNNVETCNFTAGRGKALDLVLENLRMSAISRGMKKAAGMSADYDAIEMFFKKIGVDYAIEHAKVEAFLASIKNANNEE